MAEALKPKAKKKSKHRVRAIEEDYLKPLHDVPNTSNISPPGASVGQTKSEIPKAEPDCEPAIVSPAADDSNKIDDTDNVKLRLMHRETIAGSHRESTILSSEVDVENEAKDTKDVKVELNNEATICEAPRQEISVVSTHEIECTGELPFLTGSLDNVLPMKVAAVSDVNSMEMTNTPNSDTLVDSQVTSPTCPLESDLESVEQRPLYPDLSVHRSGESEEVKFHLDPFSDEQLRTLYYNYELAQNEKFIDNFLQVVTPGQNEFQEILQVYFRARNNLANAEHDIHVLQKDYDKYRNLVWELVEEKLTVQGQCVDKAKVTAEILFTQAVYCIAACEDVTRTLKEIRTQLHDQLSLYAYESQLSRLQVESYLFDLYSKNEALFDLPTNFPVQAYVQREKKVTFQVEQLKHCLTVLFSFIRKPSRNKEFTKDCHIWSKRLTATLLRLATLEDHLYLLNQVLRCPAGVGRWAGGLIQTVMPSYEGSNESWNSLLLDHYITVLATILHPIRKREDLLYKMKAMLTPPGDKHQDNPWIFVDSDGGEDEDTEISWHYLQENDIMSLLNQLPLNPILKHILLISTDDHGRVSYDISRTTENTLLRIFAFSTCLIRLVADGLRTYSLSRYRQLNKRLGKLIKTILQAISYHWENFQLGYTGLAEMTKNRLQIEYDMVIYRGLTAILAAHRLGSWQFLAQIPYKGVSMDMLWRLLLFMHENCYHNNTDNDEDNNSMESPKAIQMCLSSDECRSRIKDLKSREVFEQHLLVMPTSEAIYLLTTFCNMAICRPSTDKDFIRDVTVEIYEIAYVKSHTRELCSKEGRELLVSIALKHPFVLSDILKITKDTMQQIGVEKHYFISDKIWPTEKSALLKVALYLYKELPFHLWLPLTEDYKVLRDWLVYTDLHQAENQLARLILEKLNWGKNMAGTGLFLDQSVHVWAAILLTDIYSAHLTGLTVRNLITEGIKHVASMMRFQETPEQQLANWAWDLAQKLALHKSMQTHVTAQTEWDDALDLHDNVSLQPIALASEKGFALASYLGLMLSKHSHNAVDFCSHGITILREVMIRHHYLPTIRVLATVLPMFSGKETYLTGNEQFLQIMKSLLKADASKQGMFFSVFPGPVTKLLAGAVQYHIQQALIRGIDIHNIIVLWLKIILKMENWNSDRDCLYLLDKVIELIFRNEEALATLKEILTGMLKSLVTKGSGTSSVLQSFTSLFVSGRSLPLLIETDHCGEFPWFAYIALLIEGEYEEECSQFWPKLQQFLITHPDYTIESAVQSVCSKLKFYMSRSPSRLTIYRWMHQIINTDVAHPVLPLLCQRFFIQYLGRHGSSSGMPQRDSVGERFFQSSTCLSLMKRMKKKLGEIVAHYHNMAMKCGKETSSQADDSTDDEMSDDIKRQQALHYVKFYQTMLFWLDEPRLHAANLCLPALPAQYDTVRLLQVFERKQMAWLDMVDFAAVEMDMNDLHKEWNMFFSNVFEFGYTSPATLSDPPATESLLKLVSEKVEAEAPPPLPILHAPIPAVGKTLLCDKESLLFTLRANFSLLSDYARVYANRVAKHVGIDMMYVELLPNLYSNETTEASVTAVCKSSFNPTHRCKGAAVIVGRYDAAKRNEIISRRIEENRAEYSQVLIESLLPPPQNICSAAVHVENAITSMIKLLQEGEKETALEIGTALFYSITTFVSEDSKFYPPTCQFFSSCIEILGQEFIRNNPAQSQPLLQAILYTPTLVGLLAPNFNPTASPDLFVTMYQDMVPVPHNQGPDVALSLLTKFDIEMWLSGRPPTSQRESLLFVIGEALCQCGKSPDDSVQSVFQVYRVHLRHLMKYQFPEHYGSTLKVLVQGSSNETLSPLIWRDFLKILGCGQTVSDELPTSPVPDLSSMLSMSHIQETFKWLSSHFMALRISNSNIANFGLYPTWKEYLPQLSTFLQSLLRKYINYSVAQMDMHPNATNVEVKVHELWQIILDTYAAWILPLATDNRLLSPWLQGDSEEASLMVKAWVSTIQALQTTTEDKLPMFARHALTMVWPQYVTHISQKSVPKHIVQVYNKNVIDLPWDRYYPDLEGIELMLKVCCSKDSHSASTDLLDQIFCKVPWLVLAEYYSKHEIPEINLRMHVCFFSMLVRISLKSNIYEETTLADLIDKAELFDWNTIDGASFRDTAYFYIDNCDPKCVLAGRGSQDSLILRLLKLAAGFTNSVNEALHPETAVKRSAYVHCIQHLICKCSHLKDANPEKFHLIITNLLTETEGVIGTVLNPAAQHEEAVSLCQEILGLLNHCNTQGSSLTVISETVINWIHESPSSSLLMPIMCASCRSLASIDHMVKVTETCMDANFAIDVSHTEGAGWGRLLAMLKVPDLDEEKFIVCALNHGCYLVLYGFILQRLPLSQSLDDELDCLSRLIFWTSKAKPSSRNESKLLLWWDKSLELINRQLAYGDKESKVIEKLKKLVPSLVSLGEDKDHSGILGAIGLGKKSQLSLRFRVLTNSLAAYLSLQVLSDGSLRRKPNSLGHITQHTGPVSPTRKPSLGAGPSQHALQCLQHLTELYNNKQYVMFREHIEFTKSFIDNPAYCIIDCQEMFRILTNRLFPDLNHLAVMWMNMNS